MKNPSHGTAMNAHLTEKQIEILGRRFCSTCNALQSAIGGGKIKHRWVCRGCKERRNAHLATLLKK